MSNKKPLYHLGDIVLEVLNKSKGTIVDILSIGPGMENEYKIVKCGNQRFSFYITLDGNHPIYKNYLVINELVARKIT
jgi:hypothetical protein